MRQLNQKFKKSHNILFSKITELVKAIYQNQEKLIQNDDISPYACSQLQADSIVEQLKKMISSNKNYSLIKLLYRLNYKAFYTGISLNLGQNLAGCAGIIFLDKITNQLKQEIQDNESKIWFIILIMSLLFCFIMKTILFSQQRWIRQKNNSIVQAQLRYLILQKSLRIQSYCDSRDHKSKIDTTQLMSVDSKDSTQIYFGTVEIITSVVTLSVIIYFIYTKLGGKPTFYGLIVLLLSVILNTAIHRAMNVLFKNKQSMSHKRISLTRDVIEGIKSIKYLGWEDIFLNKIFQVREKEFKLSKQICYLNVLASILWICLGYVLLYVFLIVYSLEGNDILKQNVFTVLALFGYIKQPLGNIPYAISYLLKALVQIKRIDTFLQQQEISQDGYEYFNQENQQNSIVILNSKFSWPRIDAIIMQHNKSNKQSQADMTTKKQSSLISQKDNRYESNDVFTLNIQELQIKKGSVNIVVGEIGSGKTAFLLSILNELDHCKIDQNQKKNIQINGSIGYVSQNHWLQSKSIKDNIIFGEAYDKSWYNLCVKACELDEDFNQFQEMDLKMVGPGGSNLSGGQRQRIAICRAIYQKKDIYLLDDVFSSLDAHVASRVYKQVVIDLLNQQLRATIILVTSHYKVIDFNYPEINVLYINNGSIFSKNEVVQKYLKQSIESDIKREQQKFNENDSIQQINIDQSLQNQLEVKVLKQNIKEINIERQILTKDINSKLQEAKITSDTKSIKSEEREKGNVSKNTLFLFFKSRGFLFTTFHFVLSFVTQASYMLTDFWLRDYTKETSNQSFLQSFFNQFFDDFHSIFKALTIINIIIAFLCASFNALSTIKSSRYIFDKLNNSIIFSRMTFFDTNPIGRIISRVSQDQNKVDDILQWHYHILLEKLSYLIGYPVGMIIQFPWTAIHFSLIIFLAYIFSKRYRVSSRQLTRLSQVNQGQVLTVITENSQGLSLIRSMNKQDHIIDEFIWQIDIGIKSQNVLDAVSIWFVLRLFMLSNSSFLLIVLSNIYMICTGNQITGNSVALGLIYSMLFSTVFSDVMTNLNYFEQDIISIERIDQYLKNSLEDLQNFQINNQKLKNLQNDIDDESKLSLVNQKQEDSCISFRNVCLNYNLTENKASDNFALKDISFDIKKGEKIAFCGRTGSGKTSILNALFRLYDISSGEIFINQKNVQQISLQELRKQISIIPQYGFLFNSSMQDNLDPSKSMTRQEINQTLKRFDSLKIINQNNKQDELKNNNRINNKMKIKNQELQQHFENTESDQSQLLNEDSLLQSENQFKTKTQKNSILDMEIQESGKNLSNGEKQIINFFRIVLRDTNILCLDEATSNMDPKTDKILHEELFKFSQNKTLIVITHRLENIEMYDRVFVMEQGQIIEQGHVTKLRNIPNGFFNRLIENNCI